MEEKDMDQIKIKKELVNHKNKIMVIRIKKDLEGKFKGSKQVNKALNGIVSIKEMFKHLTNSDLLAIKSIADSGPHHLNGFYNQIMKGLNNKGVNEHNVILLSKILCNG